MSAKDLQTRAEAWLKARMKRLTPRQRLGLVTVLLLVRQPLLPERSLLPLNTSEDDTQER